MHCKFKLYQAQPISHQHSYCHERPKLPFRTDCVQMYTFRNVEYNVRKKTIRYHVQGLINVCASVLTREHNRLLTPAVFPACTLCSSAYLRERNGRQNKCNYCSKRGHPHSSHTQRKRWRCRCRCSVVATIIVNTLPSTLTPRSRLLTTKACKTCPGHY